MVTSFPVYQAPVVAEIIIMPLSTTEKVHITLKRCLWNMNRELWSFYQLMMSLLASNALNSQGQYSAIIGYRKMSITFK